MHRLPIQWGCITDAMNNITGYLVYAGLHVAQRSTGEIMPAFGVYGIIFRYR